MMRGFVGYHESTVDFETTEWRSPVRSKRRMSRALKILNGPLGTALLQDFQPPTHAEKRSRFTESTGYLPRKPGLYENHDFPSREHMSCVRNQGGAIFTESNFETECASGQDQALQVESAVRKVKLLLAEAQAQQRARGWAAGGGVPGVSGHRDGDKWKGPEPPPMWGVLDHLLDVSLMLERTLLANTFTSDTTLLWTLAASWTAALRGAVAVGFPWPLPQLTAAFETIQRIETMLESPEPLQPVICFISKLMERVNH